jgi:hypothetical protein
MSDPTQPKHWRCAICDAAPSGHAETNLCQPCHAQYMAIGGMFCSSRDLWALVDERRVESPARRHRRKNGARELHRWTPIKCVQSDGFASPLPVHWQCTRCGLQRRKQGPMKRVGYYADGAYTGTVAGSCPFEVEATP